MQKSVHVRLPRQRAGTGTQAEETDMAHIETLPATSALQPAADVQVAGTEEELLLRRFVRSNGDIYVATYRKMLAKGSSLRGIVFEWNWSAFLGILPWALYRKMWAFLAVAALGPGLAETAVFGHAMPSLNLPIVILAAAVSKSLYVGSAVRRIRALRSRGLSDDELLARVAAKGVSRTGLIVGSIVMIAGTYVAIGTSIAAMHH
jgi:hypothetical protein